MGEWDVLSAADTRRNTIRVQERPGVHADVVQPTKFHLHTSLPLPSKIRQIDGLQVLRALAVALVAWCHECQALIPLSHRELPNLGVYGIDIFFVISGFIMSAIVLNGRQQPGIKTSWEFTKRRLIRIFPIYWVFALLYAGRLIHSRQFFRQNYFPSFLLIPFPRYPRVLSYSWTLMFEMFFYMTLAALLMITVRRAVLALVGILSTAAAVGILIGGRFQDSVWAVVLNPICSSSFSER